MEKEELFQTYHNCQTDDIVRVVPNIQPLVIRNPNFSRSGIDAEQIVVVSGYYRIGNVRRLIGISGFHDEVRIEPHCSLVNKRPIYGLAEDRGVIITVD